MALSGARLLGALSGEGASIFALGFLIAIPHDLEPDVCFQLDDGRLLWSGHFPSTIPLAIAAGPLVDHEWLFEAAAWPFWHAGLFVVFALLCTSATAATPLFARALARRCGATPWSANAVGYLTIAAAAQSYAVRPQTFAVIAFAVLVRELLGPLRRPWIAVLATLLWANVHGSVALAPATALLVAGARLVAGADAVLRRRLAVAVAAIALATLATPLGTGLYLGAREYAGAGLQTEDWQPLYLGFPEQFVSLGIFAFVLITGGVALSRANAAPAALLGAFGLLWFSFNRFLPFFDIASVPAMTAALAGDGVRQGRRGRTPRPHTKPQRPVEPWLLALPGALAVLATAAFFGPLAVRPTPAMAETDALIGSTNFHGPVYVPFAAGAYLELQQRPVRLLLDSHGTSYAADVWADWRTIEYARPGWESALARRGIAGAVAGDATPLAAALAGSAAWSRCAAEGGWTLYARNDPGSRRNTAVRCKLSIAASLPMPIPNSTPRSRAKNAGRSTISN